MKFRLVFHVAAALSLGAAALALSACGGSGSDKGGRASSVAGIPDGAAYVDQDNLKFSPSSLTVSAGEKVYFKNSETALHTVSVDGKNESGNMKKDAIFIWTPPKAGEYKITCDFHPQMKSSITVEG